MGLSSPPRCDGAEAPAVAARSEKDFPLSMEVPDGPPE